MVSITSPFLTIYEHHNHHPINGADKPIPLMQRKRIIGTPDNQPLTVFDMAAYYSGSFEQKSVPISILTETFEIKPGHGREVSSVEEAEDIIIKSIPSPVCSIDVKSTQEMARAGDRPFMCRDAYVYPAILINRQCNLIAARTRMGAGNTVLMSDFALNLLSGIQNTAFQPCRPLHYGNWTLRGTLNGAINVYEGIHFTKDTPVYVMGVFDPPGHAMLIRDNGKLFLVTDPPYDYTIRRQLFGTPGTFDDEPTYTRDFYSSIALDH